MATNRRSSRGKSTSKSSSSKRTSSSKTTSRASSSKSSSSKEALKPRGKCFVLDKDGDYYEAKVVKLGAKVKVRFLDGAEGDYPKSKVFTPKQYDAIQEKGEDEEEPKSSRRKASSRKTTSRKKKVEEEDEEDFDDEEDEEEEDDEEEYDDDEEEDEDEEEEDEDDDDEEGDDDDDDEEDDEDDDDEEEDEEEGDDDDEEDDEDDDDEEEDEEEEKPSRKKSKSKSRKKVADDDEEEDEEEEDDDEESEDDDEGEEKDWFGFGDSDDEKFEPEKSSGTWRFRLKKKERALITVLSEQPIVFREHAIRIGGNFNVPFTCVAPMDKRCPLCENGDRSYKAKGLFIINHSTYENKKGEKSKDNLQFLVLKSDAYDLVREAIVEYLDGKEKFSWKGLQLSMKRTSGKTSYTTGDVITVKKKVKIKPAWLKTKAGAKVDDDLLIKEIEPLKLKELKRKAHLMEEKDFDFEN